MKYLPYFLLLGIFISCSGLPAKNGPAPFSSPNAEEKGETVSPSEKESANQGKGGEIVRNIVKDEKPSSFLSFFEVEKFIRKNAAPGFFPITIEGKILYQKYDLYGNGLSDYFVLFVEAETPEAAAVGKLSDISLIYAEDKNPPEYYLQAFLQQNGRIFSGKRVNLGKRMVFNSLSSLKIAASSPLPYAVIADFQGVDSGQREWVIYSDSGISRFGGRKTPDVTQTIEDIDGDGVVDILSREKVLEEATGYETYLIWYKWDGKNYTVYKTTNILRNLHLFIESCGKDLEDGNWKGFLKNGVLPSAYFPGKMDDRQKIEMLLTPFSEEGMPAPGITTLQSIRDIVFPEIAEDPFVKQNGKYLFPVTIKAVEGQTSFLYQGVITLSENPFEVPQFGFLVKPLNSAAD